MGKDKSEDNEKRYRQKGKRMRKETEKGRE
jgi:hypothetical protein